MNSLQDHHRKLSAQLDKQREEREQRRRSFHQVLIGNESSM